MAILTTGRTEPPCRDNIGGIKSVFLFPFIEYSHTQIVGTRGKVLTSFPATDIYEFAISGGSMTETINNDEDGVYYDQEVNFRMTKQDYLTTNDLTILEKKVLRYIVRFNDGTYKIGGLYNGASLEFDVNSGGGKEEFNGYDIKLKGQEEWQSAFINNLTTAGFTSIDILLMEDFEPLLFETGELINLE